MIHIVIADDHHLVRQGIRALLEKQPEMRVIGEAQDGQQAIEITQATRPDVLLLDINMPLMNGIEVTKRVHESGISTQVLILSMYSDLTLVRKAFRNGARGYLLKKSITEDLINAVRAASLRQTYVSPTIPGWDQFEELITPGDQEDKDIFDRLTQRERQVCQLIAEGLTNNAIANQLNISIKTVEKHRANLMEKLGVQDVTGLIREAIRHGVIFLEG